MIQASGTRDLSQVNYSRSGVTEKGSSLSRLYQSANQKTITDNGNETVIDANNRYESESDIASKILDEKYSRINEINKRKPDPLHYIKDKYQRADSPYFRSDLSESERQAAYHNETEWLFKGEPRAMISVMRRFGVKRSTERFKEKMKRCFREGRSISKSVCFSSESYSDSGGCESYIYDITD